MRSLVVGVIVLIASYTLLLQKGRELSRPQSRAETFALEKLEKKTVTVCKDGCCTEQRWVFWFEENGKLEWVQCKNPSFKIAQIEQPRIEIIYESKQPPEWWPKILTWGLPEWKISQVELVGKKSDLGEHLYNKS